MALSLTPLGSDAPGATPGVFSTATGVLAPGTGNSASFITYTGGVCALTLALPIADGLSLDVISLTAHAHTIITPASGINGVDTTATFGGAIGDNAHFRSFGGQWISVGGTNITLS